MIEDTSVLGEFFDPDFFVYREDADVAWRAQLMGWRCIYTPLARGYHVRNVLPGNRRALPSVINMHSVKNRFLMRLKNMTPEQAAKVKEYSSMLQPLLDAAQSAPSATDVRRSEGEII